MAFRLILLILFVILCWNSVFAGEFEPFNGDVDFSRKILPKPGVASPAGSHSISYDPYGNFWCLKNGHLLLLEAGRDQWLKSSAPEDNLRFLETDEHGIIWVATKTSLFSLNPRFAGEGWLNHSSIIREVSVGAMSSSPDGGILLAGGRILFSLKRNVKSTKLSVSHFSFKSEIKQCSTSQDGSIYVETDSGFLKRKPSKNAWQKNWRLVSRLPCGNHDLSGDILNGKFYFSGGLTDGYGFPAEPKAFDKTFEFNPLTGKINTYSLGYERVYCTTSHVGGKVWIINGDIFSNGSRHSTSAVQILDPDTGKINSGPPTFTARPMPLAFNVNNRIFVIGNPKKYSDQPAIMESIGPDEKQWKKEPSGPSGMGPIAGAVLDNKIYIAVPKMGLAVFDTRANRWYTVPLKMAPRSPQMAAYKGKIWLMGGRDVPEKLVQIYDPVTGNISKGPDLPRDLAWGTAAVLNNKLYLIGGASGNCYSNRIFQFQD